MARLRATSIKEGDVLLMQGATETILEFANQYGCMPLAERPLHIPDPRKAVMASLVVAAAIGATALSMTSATIAFAAAVLAFVAMGTITGRRIYGAIDWPVIVLLASLIPIAGAMASTGAADIMAETLLDRVAQGHAVIALVLILIVTMTLSDIMNNAATAAMMCPIAIRTGEQLGSSTDPFLMAVAVGASCAFLTPIGHQNNTLIMGPGGFRFGDYWRLGLPTEILITAVAVPMILIVWPL
jgi:di/tricarboxylate transporter